MSHTACARVLLTRRLNASNPAAECNGVIFTACSGAAAPSCSLRGQKATAQVLPCLLISGTETTGKKQAQLAVPACFAYGNSTAGLLQANHRARGCIVME